ncbi:MAG: hypothetical protein GY862_35450 [Gammaproteobacteria bacterium]|nr:hypothetical protein [Gammaproteobacteria bacterium]
MSYLDQLKKEAEVVKIKEQEEQRAKAQLDEKFRMQVKPRMKNLFKYFYEMAKQLNVIKPDTRVCYDVKGAVKLENLLQSDYLIGNFNEETQTFLLRFSCSTNEKIRFEKYKHSDIQKQIDYLWKHNIRFKHKELIDQSHRFKKALFALAGNIYVEFVFSANYEESAINLTVKNFEELGKREYILRPENIDAQFIDGLAKYITRNSDDEFLKRYEKHQIWGWKETSQEDLVRLQILKEMERKKKFEQEQKILQQQEVARMKEEMARTRPEPPPPRKKGLFGLFGGKE